jgi:HSP20 family protein
MTLKRWNPGEHLPLFPRDVLSMQREINRMFDTFFRDSRGDDTELVPSAWTPATDLVEHDNDIVVRMDLPGVDRNDVKITLQNGVLMIRGEKRQEKETREAHLHRTERAWGTFQRSFTIPAGVQQDRIDAVFREGILTITLPKAEGAKPRQIDVKVK